MKYNKQINGSLLLITAMLIFIFKIYFLLVYVVYRYFIFAIIISMYIQILERKKVVLLLTEEVIIKTKVYMYFIKGEIEEKSECLAGVLFIDSELIKKIYEKILLFKLFGYWLIMILGLYLAYLYMFASFTTYGIYEYLTLFFSMTAFLIFGKEIFYIYSLYKKVRNEEYIVVNVKLDEKIYYSAFLEVEKNEEVREVSLYDLLF